MGADPALPRAAAPRRRGGSRSAPTRSPWRWPSSSPADGERELAAAPGAGLDARPRRDLARDRPCLLVPCSRHATSSSKLEVKCPRRRIPADPDGTPASELLTIGEVARRSGVAASALRFYEDKGLITSERAGSGHRRYPRPVLRRIAFIVFAQKVGLTLDEIGDELAKLPPDRAPTRRDWSRLTTSWSARIDERIAELAAPAARPDRVHRLRLPLARPLPARQPARPRRPARPRPALLDRRPPRCAGLGWRAMPPLSARHEDPRRRLHGPHARGPADRRTAGSSTSTRARSSTASTSR